MNMNRIALLLVTTFTVVSVNASDDTYLSCLKDSFKGSHNFSAEEVRSLCMEISGTQEPSYSWTEESMIPNNEFTKCYAKEVKALELLGEQRAGELAKIVCRYEAR